MVRKIICFFGLFDFCFNVGCFFAREAVHTQEREVENTLKEKKMPQLPKRKFKHLGIFLISLYLDLDLFFPILLVSFCMYITAFYFF